MPDKGFEMRVVFLNHVFDRRTYEKVLKAGKFKVGATRGARDRGVKNKSRSC